MVTKLTNSTRRVDHGWNRLNQIAARYALIEKRARELIDIMDRQSCKMRLRGVELQVLENLAEAVFENER